MKIEGVATTMISEYPFKSMTIWEMLTLRTRSLVLLSKSLLAFSYCLYLPFFRFISAAVVGSLRTGSKHAQSCLCVSFALVLFFFEAIYSRISCMKSSELTTKSRINPISFRILIFLEAIVNNI